MEQINALSPKRRSLRRENLNRIALGLQTDNGSCSCRGADINIAKGRSVHSMRTVSQSTRCSGCGEPLPDNYTLPCPTCGDTRKNLNVSVHEVAHAQDSLRWQLIHEYYERHPVLFPLVLAITIVSPFLGLVFAGWFGVSIGLIVGVITFLVGLHAVTKVRQIQEGH
jgi:hypothetical protein